MADDSVSWDLEPPDELEECRAEAAAERAAVAAEVDAAVDDADGGEEEEGWEEETAPDADGIAPSSAHGDREFEEGTLASWSYSTALGDEAAATGTVDEGWEMDDASLSGFLSDYDAASEAGSLASFAFSESSRPDFPSAFPPSTRRRVAPHVPPQPSVLPDVNARRLARKEAAAKAAAAKAAAEAARRGEIVPATPAPYTGTAAPPRPFDPKRERQLATLRAQLRGPSEGGDLGTLGEQLRALAVKQMATAARTHKHTPLPRRSAIPEYDWWQALLESVGLEVPPPVAVHAGRHV